MSCSSLDGWPPVHSRSVGSLHAIARDLSMHLFLSRLLCFFQKGSTAGGRGEDAWEIRKTLIIPWRLTTMHEVIYINFRMWLQ